jgi:hypothetical protein
MKSVLVLAIDYTGNLTGPMRLPLLGELDPRREILCLLAFKTSNLHLRKFIIWKYTLVLKFTKLDT